MVERATVDSDDESPALWDAAPGDRTASPGRSRRSGGRSRAGGRDRARAGAAPLSGDEAPADLDAAARSICLRLLTGAARSRSDLAAALLRRGIPAEVADRVLDRYTEVGLIDDDAYALALVRTKHRERGLGRRGLAAELRKKGIGEVETARALEEVNGDDELVRATQLVEKKLGSAMAAGPEAARRRLIGMLARRGYPSGLAYEVVSQALSGRGVDPGDPPDG